MFVTNKKGDDFMDVQIINELIKCMSKLDKEEKLEILKMTKGLLIENNDNTKDNYNVLYK